MGEGEKQGIKKIAKAIDTINKNTKGCKVTICLETTAGGGTQIGGKFEHLQAILNLVKHPDRVKTCLDTCHISVAGYDMTSQDKAKQVFTQYDNTVGFDNLAVFHLNDAKDPPGSKRDRHEHIGEGTVGKHAFQYIMNVKQFQNCPMILETPKKTNDKGTLWDKINLNRLRRMAIG